MISTAAEYPTIRMLDLAHNSTDSMGDITRDLVVQAAKGDPIAFESRISGTRATVTTQLDAFAAGTTGGWCGRWHHLVVSHTSTGASPDGEPRVREDSATGGHGVERQNKSKMSMEIVGPEIGDFRDVLRCH